VTAITVSPRSLKIGSPSGLDGLQDGVEVLRVAIVHEFLAQMRELQRLSESTGLSLHMKRTEPRAPRTELLPYSIDVVCLDQAGIVTGLSGFCASRGIDIAEVSTRTYPAAHTGAQMFAVQMIINVPKRLQLAHLREEFMDYCDAQNLDAILEPVKS
jgi:glycine cleavage system transcriptional repressor